MVLDCLRICQARCCREIEGLRIVFDFSRGEAAFLRRDGTILVYTKELGGGYLMKKACSGLDGIKCRWHGLPEQPKCCGDNVVGGDVCTRVRNHVRGKRFSEVE